MEEWKRDFKKSRKAQQIMCRQPDPERLRFVLGGEKVKSRRFSMQH